MQQALQNPGRNAHNERPIGTRSGFFSPGIGLIAVGIWQLVHGMAVITARRKIVTGAVSMVEMALNELPAKDVVHLDDERKAAMVSNLMVVLGAQSEVQPVINTGTLDN